MKNKTSYHFIFHFKTNSSDRGKVVKKQRWEMHRENIRVIKAGNGKAITQHRQLSLIFLCFYTNIA